MPWPVIRAVSERIYIKPDRTMQSAAVGPVAPVTGFADEENQDPFARRRRGAIQASLGSGVGGNPRTTRATDVPPGLAVDSVEEQISLFTVLKFVTVLSALYMAADPWLYLYHADDGYNMCPIMVLCVTNRVEMLLLTGSRLSAGVLFSSLTISVFSKCYATRSLLHNSWFGTVVDFEPSHDIHTYFGYLTLVAALEHAILHCVRFTYANTAYIIYETDTGRSGMVGCLLLLPIVLPMKFDFIRTKMSFQFRKTLHMLFLPLMVALCFHSVVFRYVGTILIVWYTLDRLYFTTKQTFLIDHPVFEAVGRGTMVTLDLPPCYTFKAGSYIYVNSPMINRHEWHPFSIIQVPGTAKATFYAEAVGDWTQELFHAGLEQPRLPLWITAAQPSLMEKSIYYDNVVLVCTGAGITPAVSIIERFAKRKNIHLLWMTRDGGMVALFEKQLRQVNSTVHLTGTPDTDTKDALQRLLRPSETNDAAAMPRLSFRSIVANGALTTRPSSMSMVMQHPIDDDADELDTLPSRQPVLQGTLNRSWSSRQQPQTSYTAARPADPVRLAFGRPDIGAYLTTTFAMVAEAPCTNTEVNSDATSPMDGVSDSSRGTRSTAGLPERQMSTRLDAEQKVSKKNLMKADASVVEACHQQRNKRAMTKRSAACASSAPSRPHRPLPWLVLYCGANPRVEEAIAKTCDELRVHWQKEYFGAW